MESRQLEYFVAVAEELNFTKAAGRLFAVQSTVSAGIRSLERDLGALLFDRSTKRVTLTAAGTALLPEARAAIEALDRVRSSVAPTSEGIRGRLRVGIFTSLDFVDLPGAMGEFHAQHPFVDVQLIASPTGSTGLAEDVRNGRIDVAFTGLPLRDLGGFQVLELARSDFVVIVPRGHPLSSHSGVGLAELSGERWIDSPTGFANRLALERALANAGLGRTVSAQIVDLGDVPQFVAAGLGIAVIPRITYRPTEGVVAVPLAGNAVDWVLSAISRPMPTPATAALLDLFEERIVRKGEADQAPLA